MARSHRYVGLMVICDLQERTSVPNINVFLYHCTGLLGWQLSVCVCVRACVCVSVCGG